MSVARGRQVAIGVPVRNEAARLPRLLEALAAQAEAPLFTLCLFFDNCTDGSEALAAALAPALPFAIRSDRRDDGGAPNAGLARGRALALADAAAPEGILLTTDADSEPAPGWIANSLAALGVADVVAGRIVRGGGPSSAAHARIEAYYDRLHALRRAIDPVPWEPGPAHHWASGASLAMDAATYRALGGFAPMRNGEDAALCDAAARAGYRLRRDPAVVVRTSARRRGRACGGFAAALALLDDGCVTPSTGHPEDEAWRFRMQARARRLFELREFDALAAALGLPLAEVREVAAECRNGEAFAARIVAAPPGGMRSIGLNHAELVLSTLEQSPLEGVA